LSTPPPAQPVAVLLSGRGSNLAALVERSHEPSNAYRVVLVLSDNPGAPGLVRAREFGLPCRTLPAAAHADDRAGYDRALAAALDACAPSLLVLAGFMRILSAEFVARYAGRILNIHPSLLPKYPGLHTHRRALAAHDAVHGATVHYVTAQLDGGPRIIQARVAIRPGDDEAALAARVLREEHRIYPLAVSWHAQGRLCCRDGQAWLDGAALATPVVVEETDPARREA
jgi:phosphoribosylglycinamide formyltransferase-1